MSGLDAREPGVAAGGSSIEVDMDWSRGIGATAGLKAPSEGAQVLVPSVKVQNSGSQCGASGLSLKVDLLRLEDLKERQHEVMAGLSPADQAE